MTYRDRKSMILVAVIGSLTASEAADMPMYSKAAPLPERIEYGNLFFGVFIASLIILASLSVYFLPHIIEGDAVSYVNAIRVYEGAVPQPHLLANQQEINLDVVTIHRMLTTPLGIQAVRISNHSRPSQGTPHRSTNMWQRLGVTEQRRACG